MCAFDPCLLKSTHSVHFSRIVGRLLGFGFGFGFGFAEAFAAGSLSVSSCAPSCPLFFPRLFMPLRRVVELDVFGTGGASTGSGSLCMADLGHIESPSQCPSLPHFAHLLLAFATSNLPLELELDDVDSAVSMGSFSPNANT